MKLCQQMVGLLRIALLYGAVVALHAATLVEQDLASDTAWTISVADGPFRPIVVPGGAWTSDQQLPQGLPRGRAWELLPDHVVYRRNINIPDGAADRVIKILFGGVNHGAEVYINDKVVTTHVGPQMPFEADITDQVKPGGTYALKVKVYSTAHYGRAGGVPWFARGQGIVRYIKLAVYPQVNIKDVFVRTLVGSRQLVYDVWVHNAGSSSRSVVLDGKLASYNKSDWTYPSLPARAATLPPGTVTKLTVGPVAWNLGQASYWWPNIPFREDYAAQLHNLNLTLKQGTTPLDAYTQRFGFAEYGEGPYYYTINGVRIGVQAAASDTEPAEGFAKAAEYLPPTGPGTGCPETWRRYLRLGVNTLRTHQTTPSDYMLQAADEVGFMIIPETPIRGSDNSNTSFGPVHMPQAERELAYVSRNHPSVCRYSLYNEADGRLTGGGAFIEPPGPDGKAAPELTMLIDAIREVDDTRPLVVECDQHAPYGRIDGANGGHAYAMLHYQNYRDWPQKQTIIGLGEFAFEEWPPTYCALFSRFAGGSNAALVRLGDLGLDMRMRDIPYFSILSVTGFWTNFLEGRTGRRDRKDRVDGWGSEEITFIQRALDPYVVVDREYQSKDNNFCYTKGWPLTPPWYTAGQTIHREVEVFNGGLCGDRMSLIWEARWDSPTGKLAASGVLEAFRVEPGFHLTKTISLLVPASDASAKPIATPGGGRIVYTEDRLFFNVDERKLYFILKSVLYGDGSRSEGRATD
jgi:hypothetical protein